MKSPKLRGAGDGTDTRECRARQGGVASGFIQLTVNSEQLTVNSGAVQRRFNYKQRGRTHAMDAASHLAKQDQAQSRTVHC